MVFGLNAAGVPSVSKSISIGSTTAKAAATMPLSELQPDLTLSRSSVAAADPTIDVAAPTPPSTEAATAEVPPEEYPVLPVAPAVPMAPGLQLD
jgi:hypothetical protein